MKKCKKLKEDLMNNRDLIAAIYKNIHTNSTLHEEEIDEELATGLYGACSLHFERMFISMIHMEDLLEHLTTIHGAEALIDELKNYV